MSALNIAEGICLGFLFMAIGKVVCEIVADAFANFWTLAFVGWEGFGLYRLYSILNTVYPAPTPNHYAGLAVPEGSPWGLSDHLWLWAMMFVGVPLVLWGFTRLDKWLGKNRMGAAGLLLGMPVYLVCWWLSKAREHARRCRECERSELLLPQGVQVPMLAEQAPLLQRGRLVFADFSSGLEKLPRPPLGLWDTGCYRGTCLTLEGNS